MVVDSLLVIITFFVLFYIISLAVKNNTVADIAWGTGFLVAAAFNFAAGGTPRWHDILLLCMVSLWSLRLALHITLRSIGKKEDFRYRKWREEWGRLFAVRSFFQIYLLQALLQFTVALPIIFSFSADGDISTVTIIAGALIFTAGLLFETTADRQLSGFIKDPDNRGKLMTSGLWSLSRHPNYFGEFVVWVGIFVYSAGKGASVIGIISPVLMYVLLNHISGIPLLEKKYKGREDYEAYRKSTGAFFPYRKK